MVVPSNRQAGARCRRTRRAFLLRVLFVRRYESNFYKRFESSSL
jgi:hypothetical protein